MRKEVEGDFADLLNKFYRKNLALLFWMLFQNLWWKNCTCRRDLISFFQIFHMIYREISVKQFVK